MAIESISTEVSKELEKRKMEEDLTVHGCHIKVDGDRVIVKLPKGKEFIQYEFPKREIKELFEKLYTE